MKKGKLIVFEGIDGSGKTTQLNLLLKYLKSKSIPHETIDFPQYKNNFFGQTARRYLTGEFGNNKSVNPYLVSLIFAMDRSSVRGQINSWLRDGKIVLANRYATSNMAHQAAKLPGNEREKYLKWEQELEYRVNKIPKENKVIFLDLPVSAAQKLLAKRGKMDMHEIDESYLTETRNVYEILCRENKHWSKIDCIDSNKSIRSPNEIHNKVLEVFRKVT